jgi:predicted GIY-YIG superfamily endonuclease
MSRVSGKTCYVYILWSPGARRFYIGISEDPQKRLAQHNQAQRGRTARHALCQLVYSERCADHSVARRQLKAQECGEGFWTATGLDPSRFTPSSWGS